MGFPTFVESRPPGLLFASDDASIPRVAKTTMVGSNLGAKEIRRRFATAMRRVNVDGFIRSAILRRPEPNKFDLVLPLDIMREAIERLAEFD